MLNTVAKHYEFTSISTLKYKHFKTDGRSWLIPGARRRLLSSRNQQNGDGNGTYKVVTEPYTTTTNITSSKKRCATCVLLV